MYDGCPRSFSDEIWWPRSKFGTTTVHDCPSGAIGLATRECLEPKGWDSADVFNCTSTSFISILNIIAQLDSNDLVLSPLLSIKLAGDLYKALNSSNHLYGNDLWISLRLLNHLIKHETEQKGLYLSHRQDKNFIKVGLIRAIYNMHEYHITLLIKYKGMDVSKVNPSLELGSLGGENYVKTIR